MDETVGVAEQDGVVEIRLNRVEKKNALNVAMYEACIAALVEGCGRDSARVFLITSEGPTFTAGNDIGEFLRAGPDLGASPGGRFIEALARCGKPIVAAVQGAAIGIGATMLLHCDLVYASPEASLSVPFVAMGLVPEAGSSLLMPLLLGRQRAARLLLLGEAMGAEEAREAGLVSGIVPVEQLRAHAREKAKALASRPQAALATSRALMRPDSEVLTAHMRREMEAFGRAVRGPEAREAFAAFLEKRAPVFDS